MKKSWLMRSWSQPMKLTDAELELVNGANAAEDSPSPAPPDPKKMPRRGMCSHLHLEIDICKWYSYSWGKQFPWPDDPQPEPKPYVVGSAWLLLEVPGGEERPSSVAHPAMEASNPIKRCFCGGFEVPQSGATKLQCDRRSCPRRLIGRGSWRATLPKLLELHNNGQLDSAFPGLDIHGLTAHVARKYAAHGPSVLVRVDKFHQNPKPRFQVTLNHFYQLFANH